MTQDNLLDLIDDIYAAGLEPSLWPAILARLADTIGARDAALGILGQDATPILIAPRTDPDFAISYQQYYHPLNLFGRSVTAQPVGLVTTDAMLMPRERLHASEFFNDWAAPQNYRSVMGTTLVRSETGRIELQLPSSRDFDTPEIELVTRLVPHITRAAQLTQLLAAARLQQQGFLKALDVIDQGLIVLDARLCLLHANATAERHLRSEDGLSATHRGMVAKHPGENRQLQAILGTCTRPGLDGGGTLRISRTAGAPLTLTVTPLPRDSAFALPHGRILVTIADPEKRSHTLALQVQQRYGLTGAELALLLEIAKGEGRKTAASRRGITVATARTQLSSIFDKTGVRRQAELVRLLHEGT